MLNINQIIQLKLVNFIGYALVSCHVDLISIFNINDYKELINSPVTI